MRPPGRRQPSGRVGRPASPWPAALAVAGSADAPQGVLTMYAQQRRALARRSAAEDAEPFAVREPTP